MWCGLPIQLIERVEPYRGLAAFCRAVAKKARLSKFIARFKTSFLRQGRPLEETQSRGNFNPGDGLINSEIFIV